MEALLEEGARIDGPAAHARRARGPGAGGAHRRAHRAQPARPALRDRDADPPLRRRSSRGTGATILDTRKTTPGLRALEKYAVRCGGGTNHRAGLYDAILVKENHLRIAGGIAPAVAALRNGRPIEVEAETLDEVAEALEAGVERILLDNMTPAEVARAVELVAGRAQLEASGGISLANVRAYAETGVDFISVGALTHSARSLDVSLEVE